ncbi:hypothetical protein JTB14_019287 [Gonioctena quinquepunctata]|nr:hypothetical protein JTB14_019287 [Gonioctena quinquepunctata]
MAVALKDFTFRGLFWLEETVLSFTGFHRNFNNEWLGFQTVRASVSMACLMMNILSCIISIYYYKFDAQVGSVMVFVCELRFFVKLLFFLVKRKYFVRLLLDLETPVFQQTGFFSEQIENKTKVTLKLGQSYFCSVIICIFFFCMKPFFTKTDRFLLVSVWSPLNMENAIHRSLNFAFQIIVMFLSAFCNVSIDNTFRMFTSIACCQSDLITYNLRKINFKNTTEARALLKKTIIHHLEVLKYVDSINHLFTYITLVQYLTSIGVICITMFQSTINSEISQALYDTNWYEAEISEMKTIIIMMERCKKPIQLKVGGVLQLSYDSFILILKKSYSFLTVLRQIYSSHQWG